MKIKKIQFRSIALKRCMDVNIIFPNNSKLKSKVLWLLHGGYGNCDEWVNKSNIKSYVTNKNIMVVMPSIADSFYTDVIDGDRNFHYLSVELPKLLEEKYSIPILEMDNYVVGTSIGGYGAFKLALLYPKRYKFAVGLSGSYDIKAIYDYAVIHNKPTADMFIKVFGSVENFTNNDNNIFYLLKKSYTQGNLPKLYAWCGTDDFLYYISKNFIDYANSENIPIVYNEDFGKTHCYEYWDTKLEEIIDMMYLD